MLREKLKSMLTRHVLVQDGHRKKLKRVEVPPSERLVLGIYFASLALVVLTVLQLIHVVWLGSWNSELGAAITGDIMFVLGVLFGQKVS